MKVRVQRKVDWRSTEENPKPDVSFMPMMARRRLSLVERAAMHVAWGVFSSGASGPVDGPLPEPGTVPVVFASRWGEIGTTLKLFRQFHSDREMSPAAFPSSVHNAAPGAWSLFTGSRAPYTAVSAGERTYEMGLLEAEAQLTEEGVGAVLFVYAEESTPSYYRTAFNEPVQAHAVALLLVPDRR